MILNSPTISGSLTVTGNIITSGSITISGSIASASYATNAELLDGLDSTAFATTGAYSATSASLYATSASLSATSGSLSATSGSLSATSGSLSTASGSFDTRVATIESKYATTGSNTFTSTQVVSGSILQSGSFTTTGTIIAQTINVQTVTSSVVYSSGSNVFGNSIGNSQTFTGSVLITGSLTIAGNITSNGAAFFAGAVCVSNIISTGTSGGRYGTFNAPTNGGYITFEAGGTAFGDLGSYCAQYGTGDATTLLLGSRTGYALALGSNSTERLRITCAGNVGIGTCSPSYKLQVNGASGTIARITDGTNNLDFYAGSSLNEIAATTSLLLSTNGATRLTIACTGAATFSGDLTIGGTANTQSSLSLTRLKGYSNYYDASNRYGDYGKLIFNADSSWTSAARRWLITNAVNNTTFAIIRSADSSTDPSLGNAGAVDSGTVDFQISNAGAATFSSSVTAISSNFTTTSNTYTTQGTISWNDVRGLILRAKTASVYDFAIYSAAEASMIVNPTGTNNVAFLNGNIGIGTSTPVCTNLVGSTTIVKSYNGDTPTSTTAQTYYINQSNLYLFGRNAGLTMVGNANEESVIAFGNPYAYYVGGIRYGMGSGPAAGDMVFQTCGVCERMRITSGGNIGIGTSSINSKLTIYEGDIRLFKTHIINCTGTWASNIFFTDEVDRKGAAIVGERTAWDGAPMALGFETGGVNTITRRMTITSGGEIQLSGDLKFNSANTVYNASGDFYVRASTHLRLGAGGTNSLMTVFNNGNVSINTSDIGYKLNLNGQPGANGYTAWTNYSDSRLKENVTDFDATNVLDKINRIRPVTYNYNELSGFDEATRERRISGFIAQELMEVFPDMVGTIKKEDTEYYDTNLSNLNLYLVKAIQELKAENDIFKTCLGIS